MARAGLNGRGEVLPVGPRMLHHLLLREPERDGLRPGEAPSPTTIARMLREAGLAAKPVGP